MDGIFRRPSGVYYARLVVPTRLRQIIRKTELVATTGTRDFAIAKIIGAELVASWRRQLRAAQGLDPMDLLQVSVGSPLLTMDSPMSMEIAASASGLDRDELLGLAASGGLRILIQPGQCSGFFVPLCDLDRDAETGGFDVPPPRLMPASAQPTDSPGLLAVRRTDNELVAHALQRAEECPLVLLDTPARPGSVFAPASPLDVTAQQILLYPAEIEAQRQAFAATITAAQLEAERAARASSTKPARKRRKASEAMGEFMKERSRSCSPDQARRIQAACELFVELTGDPWLDAVDREFLRHYRDKLLPEVPANENKVRLVYRTLSVSESIAAVAGVVWPRISESECAKRMQWLCGMFEWLAQEKWIDEDISVGLAAAIRPREKKATHTKRDRFTSEDLQKIFSAEWFQTGRGKLTRKGTYREFLPYYYWLPLLGLYTGARINELCQLSLSDIRKSDAGTWYIDINEDDEEENRRVKNAQSRRKIPVHPHLIELGLPSWHDALKSEGHERLFPELLFDEVKGYSKAAVKWFSAYLGRFGWPRNGKKVFHSFRHTLASECLNVLKLSLAETAQISGHQRDASILGGTYRKDVEPDDIAADVARLSFKLPLVAEFDPSAGLKALKDALMRKRVVKR